MTLISIVIPAYNAEGHIEKCVDSVLKNKGDFEVIIVDDGSVDGTLMKCEELASKNSRIVVLSKLNGGASSARNYGIKNAKGSYLMFLDSDDYWESSECIESIQKKVLKTPKIDVLMFGVRTYNTQSKKWKNRVNFELEDVKYLDSNKLKDNLEYLYNNSLFPSSAWSIVINRKFVVDNSFYFKEGIVAEDIDWMVGIMKENPQISAIEDNFYRYHKLREGSVTSISGEKTVVSLLFILDKWIEKLDDKNKIDRVLLKFLSFHYSTIFLAFSKLDNKSQEKYSASIKNYLFLLENLSSWKINVLKIFISVFGLKRGSALFTYGYGIYLKNN